MGAASCAYGSLQYACEKLSDRAIGYGIPGLTVDGTDAMAVVDAVRGAVCRARAGGGPSLIECTTLRMRGHGEHDNNEYVPSELIEQWERKDPIQRLRTLLDTRNILAAADADAMRETLAADVVAVAERVAAEPDPAGDDVLADGGAYYSEP